MSLRFRQLQAVHAVIETGSVTGAARNLGVSQPAISNQLSLLESETRLRLFDRQKGRLVPTPEAVYLVSKIDTVMRGIDHVQQAVVDLQSQQTGQLQVASTHALSLSLIPKLIAQFAQARSGLNVSFQSQYSSKIQEWILTGLFEIGVCELPLMHDGLAARTFRFETRLALQRDDPLCQHDVLTPELLHDHPLVVMGPQHMVTRRLQAAFDEAGVTMSPRCHTHLFRNVLSFVQEGLGAGLVDPFTWEGDNDTRHVLRPFQPAIHLDMAIITSPERPLSEAGQAFFELLTTQLQQLAARSDPNPEQF